MINTVSMRVNPPRRPYTIPTQRSRWTALRTTALLAALATGFALLALALLGHSRAHADAGASNTRAGSVSRAQTSSPAVAGSAAEARAAVQALPVFPDAYPVAAGIAP